MSTVADDHSNGRVLAFWLVLGHFVVGLIGCAVSRNTLIVGRPSLPAAAFAGLMFAQASLLGLWFSLGTGRWRVRLAGVLLGLAYLAILFCFAIDDVELELVFLVVFPGLMVAGLFGICRCFGLRIRSIAVEKSEKTAAQFSIRQLMLLTLVVACLSAVAEWLDVEFRAFPVLALIAGPFLFLGTVAVWGILGTKRPTLGIVAVPLLAALLGYGLASVVNDVELAGLWIVATMTGALFFGVSLCVIRRYGFRVKRQPKGGSVWSNEQETT